MTSFHGSVIFHYMSALSWYMDILFHDMYEFDKTFGGKVFLGHCDLISWFSDFALYLDTQLVFFHTSF